MNPMNLMKYRQMLETFRENHPKLPLFLKAASQRICEGSVVEIKLKDPDGQEIVTNFLVNQQDMELIRELGGMGIQ